MATGRAAGSRKPDRTVSEVDSTVCRLTTTTSLVWMGGTGLFGRQRNEPTEIDWLRGKVWSSTCLDDEVQHLDWLRDAWPDA
jgi:hypothetical protein